MDNTDLYHWFLMGGYSTSVVARVRNAVMLRAYQAQWWQG